MNEHFYNFVKHAIIHSSLVKLNEAYIIIPYLDIGR
jgi:hypothetical protein